ncbi:M67 family metallopeptidase [Paenibacillus harenae]|uniref:M67 family metallopeptidase n=1 Tax=Paenibacillus harenae TaxID=306543 RepID=UPI002790B91E|nr:M67 family metallopeptidase [Paenibacillus harenae]MDQ0058431.1 proteasome lid subunit RPN8/RPN11 [Paenibacillus harenae]
MEQLNRIPIHEVGLITRQAYNQLLSICLGSLPEEACGIVASRTSAPGDDLSAASPIDTIIPIRNIHSSPRTAFKFDPEQWTSAYYEMQTNRQSLVGLFHSHPSTEAIPSSLDQAGFWPASSISYWIVSLADRSSPRIQPYRRIHGGFEPLELVFA